MPICTLTHTEGVKPLSAKLPLQCFLELPPQPWKSYGRHKSKAPTAMLPLNLRYTLLAKNLQGSFRALPKDTKCFLWWSHDGGFPRKKIVSPQPGFLLIVCQLQLLLCYFNLFPGLLQLRVLTAVKRWKTAERIIFSIDTLSEMIQYFSPLENSKLWLLIWSYW